MGIDGFPLSLGFGKSDVSKCKPPLVLIRNTEECLLQSRLWTSVALKNENESSLLCYSGTCTKSWLKFTWTPIKCVRFQLSVIFSWHSKASEGSWHSDIKYSARGSPLLKNLKKKMTGSHPENSILNVESNPAVDLVSSKMLFICYLKVKFQKRSTHRRSEQCVVPSSSRWKEFSQTQSLKSQLLIKCSSTLGWGSAPLIRHRWRHPLPPSFFMSKSPW